MNLPILTFAGSGSIPAPVSIAAAILVLIVLMFAAVGGLAESRARTWRRRWSWWVWLPACVTLAPVIGVGIHAAFFAESGDTYPFCINGCTYDIHVPVGWRTTVLVAYATFPMWIAGFAATLWLWWGRAIDRLSNQAVDGELSSHDDEIPGHAPTDRGRAGHQGSTGA